MNKSVKKCCICNNEQIGEFITIEDKKYHLTCIKELTENYFAVLRQRDDISINATEKIEKLLNNWNELKKWLEDNKYFYSGLQGEDREEDTTIIEVLNKMAELERGEE